MNEEIKLWIVTVQENKKPFSFAKVKLLIEVSKEQADRLHERAMKHPHLDKNCNVVWLSFKDEKSFNITEKTFIYFEDFK